MPKKINLTRNAALNRKLEKLERTFNKRKPKHKPKLERFDKYHERVERDVKKIDFIDLTVPVLPCPF